MRILGWIVFAAGLVLLFTGHWVYGLGGILIGIALSNMIELLIDSHWLGTSDDDDGTTS